MAGNVTLDPATDILRIELEPELAPWLRRPVRSVSLSHGVTVEYDDADRAVRVLVAGRPVESASSELVTAESHAWLTLGEAAAEIGIAASTLRGQILRKRIPATKRGRDWSVQRRDALAYAEAQFIRQQRALARDDDRSRTNQEALSAAQ